MHKSDSQTLALRHTIGANDHFAIFLMLNTYEMACKDGIDGYRWANRVHFTHFHAMFFKKLIEMKAHNHRVLSLRHDEYA
jgi:hypothetical protein